MLEIRRANLLDVDTILTMARQLKGGGLQEPKDVLTAIIRIVYL